MDITKEEGWVPGSFTGILDIPIELPQSTYTFRCITKHILEEERKIREHFDISDDDFYIGDDPAYSFLVLEQDRPKAIGYAMMAKMNGDIYDASFWVGALEGMLLDDLERRDIVFQEFDTIPYFQLDHEEFGYLCGCMTLQNLGIDLGNLVSTDQKTNEQMILDYVHFFRH